MPLCCQRLLLQRWRRDPLLPQDYFFEPPLQPLLIGGRWHKGPDISHLNTSPSSDSNSAFISDLNLYRHVIPCGQHSGIHQECEDLSTSSTGWSLWPLAKSISNIFYRSPFLSLHRSDGTTAPSLLLTKQLLSSSPLFSNG